MLVENTQEFVEHNNLRGGQQPDNDYESTQPGELVAGAAWRAKDKKANGRTSR